MKRGPREPIPNYGHIQDVRAAFLYALNDRNRGLGSAAFDELCEIARGDASGDLDAIDAWTMKWNVHAPCVLEAADTSVKDARRPGVDKALRGPEGRIQPVARTGQRVGGDCRFVVSRARALPQAWHHKMATTNDLSVEFTNLDDGVAAGTMSVPSTRDDGTLDGTTKVVNAPLERLLEQDYIRAPIATDPCRESLDNFIQRARHHWQARAQMAEREGLTPIAPKSDLGRHLGWLLLFQLRNKSFSAIGKSDGGLSRQAVDSAVRGIARLLDLRLRPVPRGGARPHSRRVVKRKK